MTRQQQRVIALERKQFISNQIKVDEIYLISLALAAIGFMLAR